METINQKKNAHNNGKRALFNSCLRAILNGRSFHQSALSLCCMYRFQCVGHTLDILASSGNRTALRRVNEQRRAFRCEAAAEN